MSNKKQLLNYVQKNDTEWYPTTDKAINLIKEDIIKNDYQFNTILEPCCGDGRVSKEMAKALKEEPKLFGIEINDHLRVKAKANNINLVGSNFLDERFFMDDHNMLYLNPPFSNWKYFFTKTMLEFSEFPKNNYRDYKIAYMILPPRALEDESFHEVMDSLKIKHIDIVNEEITSLSERTNFRRYLSLDEYSYWELLDTIDFREADRGARVDAPLIKIRLKYDSSSTVKADKFFEFAFGEKIKRSSVQDDLDAMFKDAEKDRAEYEEKKKNQLLTGSDIVEMEVSHYSYKFQLLIQSIRPLLYLPQETLDLFKIKTDMVQETFKQKEKQLRHNSWTAIFEQLDSMKDKLTTTNRAYLISSFAKDLDFTHTNIREIVISSIKFAGSVMESQIADFYWKLIDDILSTKDRYWSNEIYTKNVRKFRYQRDDKNTLMLDYRVILKDDKKYDNSWQETGTWTSRTLEDFRVSALLLGFNKPYWDYAGIGELSTLYKSRNHLANPLKKRDKTDAGAIKEVHIQKDEDGTEWVQYLIGDYYLKAENVNADKDILMTARSFKKGTLHIKMNQELLMKITYVALKDKNIINGAGEFEEYMSNIKSDEKDSVKLTKDELKTIQDIKVNGVNPQIVFKKELEETKLLGIKG